MGYFETERPLEDETEKKDGQVWPLGRCSESVLTLRRSETRGGTLVRA